MKKHNLLFATLLFVVAAVSVAVVSCKKEDTKALSNNNSKETFDPRQIDDMNAYLKDFKDKMLSATKGEEEAFSFEEAAWHISSLANYDFGYVNVEYDGFIFDTLYAQVNVINGVVLLGDLGVAYEKISTDMDKYYQNLNYSEKHFRFIGADISENGKVTLPLMVTFCQGSKHLNATTWYFDDEWDALVNCSDYFDQNFYYAATTGRQQLEWALNLIESHPTNPTIGRIYFTISRYVDFYYLDNIDPYGSPFYLNSRLFAAQTANPLIIQYDMCYLFDSCLGLGYDERGQNEGVVKWEVYHEESPTGNPLRTYSYRLRVYYGIPTQQGGEPDPGV